MQLSSNPALRQPLVRRAAALAVLAVLGLALFVVAAPIQAQTCGSPLDFNGTYSQACTGQPALVLHGAIAHGAHKEQYQRRLPLYCQADDPRFLQALEEVRADVERLCLAVGGSDCTRGAADFAAGLQALDQAIIGSLPQRTRVAAFWNQIPFQPHRHRLQLHDSYADGQTKMGEHVLDNRCEHRGDFALPFRLPLLQGEGGRQGICLVSGVLASSGHIDPATFRMERSAAFDGSLTCLADGLAINLGATLEVHLQGQRH